MNFRAVWIPVVALLIFTSCGNYLYKSPTPKVPLFSARNDFRFAVNSGLNETFGLYTAYAPINYLGVSLATSQFCRIPLLGRNDVRLMGDYEFSVIPYFPYKFFRFEMPLGIGLTQLQTSSSGYVPSSPYQRLFLQPTFGICTKNFEFGTYVRMSQLDYSLDILGTDTRNEIGLMIRSQTKYCKFMFQYRNDYGTNYSRTPAAHLLPKQQIHYLPFYISIGVQIDLNLSLQPDNKD